MKFVDLDKEICDLIRQEIPQLEVINGSLDDIEGNIISTASNPMFTFGGGLDKYLDKRFLITEKDLGCDLSRGMVIEGDEKIKHIYLNITVDENIKPSKESIKTAYERYLHYCNKMRYKDIILTAFGTGIGGFGKKEMVKILKQVINENV